MFSFIQHLQESDGPFDFSSTQVNIPEPEVYRKLVRLLLDTGNVVKSEMDTHVTVRYGLHTNDAEDVRPVIASTGPISLTISHLDVFEHAPEHDVIVFKVNSQGLRDLNERLGALPNTQTYPYNPHLTLAYLRKGTGRAMVDLLTGLPATEDALQTFTFSEIVFSNHAGEHTILPLC